MPDFKVGDKVRLVDCRNYTDRPVGSIGKIVELSFGLRGETFYMVQFDGEDRVRGGFYPWRFELVAPPSAFEQRVRAYIERELSR